MYKRRAPNCNMSNFTSDFDDSITRLQDALEDAKNMPGWGIALVVVVALLCAIILLHVLALMAAGPCLWAMWMRRKQLDRSRLLTDEIIDPDVGMELSPAAEAALGTPLSDDAKQS